MEKKIKIMQTIPIVSEVIIVLNGVEYDGKILDGIEFHCDPEGIIHQACRNRDRYSDWFIMGSSFFKKHFLVKEEKRIEQLCKKEVIRVKKKIINMKF